VSRVAEVSALLDSRDPAAASRAVLRAPGVDQRGHSDYGAAFAAFHEHAGGCLDRRTVLLILGDGRGNFRDPGLDTLADWRRRCRRLFWFNPEEPGRWNHGDSRADRYAEAVDEFRDISTVARLLETLLELG